MAVPPPAPPVRPAIAIHPAIPAVARTGGVFVPPPPANVPTTVQHSNGVMTVNPAIVHLLNPGLLPPRPFPQPRTAFAPPSLVAPGNPATDSMLFETPANPAQRFFLPHYAIATAPGGGPRARWVSVTSTGDGCHLAINLADITPASLSNGNQRVSAGVTFLLTTALQGKTTTWALTPSTPPAGADLTLTLDVADFASRDLLYVAMTDPTAQTQLIIRHDLDLALPAYPPPNAYMHSKVAVDTTIPFVFNKDLDANVFVGLHGASSQLPGWNIVAVNWNGVRHAYYQATNQPDQVYYLPDSFVVGRQAVAPFRPAFAIAASGSDAASMQMTMSYTASPFWSPERISAASAELKTRLGLNAPPTMALFQPTNAALFLNLPNADGSVGTTVTEQKGALIDVAAGVQGTVTLDATHFRTVYNAFFDPSAVLMSGEVRVTVANDVETIPFKVQIAQYPGPLITSETTVDVPGNTVQVVLTNAIDAAVHVESLTGTILKNGVAIPSSIVSTSSDLPFDIWPAGANTQDDPPGFLTVTLAPPKLPTANDALTQVAGSLLGNLLTGGHLPTSGQIGQQIGATVKQAFVDNTCTASLDLSKLTPVMDRDAIWKAVLDDRGGTAVTYSVVVECAPLPTQQPAPPNAVIAVQVVFEGGQTATFSAFPPDGSAPPTQTVKLSAPLDAFILGDGPLNNYKYRVDIVTGTGTKQGEWVANNADHIFVVAS